MAVLTKPGTVKRQVRVIPIGGDFAFFNETEHALETSPPAAQESLNNPPIEFLEFLGEGPTDKKAEQLDREPIPKVFYEAFGEIVPSKGQIVFNETIEVSVKGVNQPLAAAPETSQFDPGQIIDRTVLSGLKVTEAVGEKAAKVTVVAGKEAKEGLGFIFELSKYFRFKKEKSEPKDPKKEQEQAEIKAQAQFIRSREMERQKESRSVVAENEAKEDARLGIAGKSADQLNTESGTQKGFRIFDAIKSIANRMWILEKNRRSAIEQARNKQKPNQIFKSRAGKMDMRLDAQEGNSTAGNAIKSTG